MRAISSVGQSYRLITGWSGVRVPDGPPGVMVYKSFLIDHHFCIFRGIFAPF